MNRLLDLRYRDLFNIEDQTLHIFGCGAVGSNSAMILVRMGARKFVLYDMDTVGEENIGVSVYLPKQLGKKKVEALAQLIIEIEPEAEIQTIGEVFSGSFTPKGKDCALVSFDSMSARKEVAEAVCKFSVGLLVDSRMGAETLQMYSFKNPTLAEYMAHWYPDEGSDEEPCSSKATSYCANIAGALAASVVRKAVMGQPMAETEIMDLTTYMSKPTYIRGKAGEA